MRFGDSGGIDSGATDYGWSNLGSSEGAVDVDEASTGDDAIVTEVFNIGSDTGEAFSACIYVSTNSASSTINNSAYGITQGSRPTAGGMHISMFAGCRNTHIDLTDVQFFYDAGATIEAGSYIVYGIV